MSEETTTFDQVKAAATLVRMGRVRQVLTDMRRALGGLEELNKDPVVAEATQCIENEQREVHGRCVLVMQEIVKEFGPEWDRASTRALSSLERQKRLAEDLARLREGDWGPVAARAVMELERAIESLEAGDPMPSPGP